MSQPDTVTIGVSRKGIKVFVEVPAAKFTALYYDTTITLMDMAARLATDQEFSDMFDTVMTSDGFDGTVFISQMLYNVNQTVTAWEGNANYRDVLGLPPL